LYSATKYDMTPYAPQSTAAGDGSPVAASKRGPGGHIRKLGRYLALKVRPQAALVTTPIS